MGTRSTPAHALAAPLMVLLLALTACGSDTSVADPPVAPSPTSPSSAAAPPRETPEHFIRRWAAVEKKMENTGQSEAYLALSSRCRACRELATDISRFYSRGGYARWGGWRISSIAGGHHQQGSLIYTVHVDSAPTIYKASASARMQHLAGGPAAHQLTVRFMAGGWRVTKKVQVAE